MSRDDELQERYELLAPELNEKTLRLFAGAEAVSQGRGGIARVARVTGVSRGRVSRGMQELLGEEDLDSDRIRQPGGGRKALVERDPTLLRDLDRLVSPHTRGDPESPLRWTSKSLRKLTGELVAQGHRVSHTSVASLLREMKYSLQANRKTREGKQHPDRDAQFKYINQKTKAQQRKAQPVISVDTKKKELVGGFSNKGKEWHPQGKPTKTRVHDFKDKELGKVAPYGVYDLTLNDGWVSVGVDHDTASFAAASIQQWWKNMGRLAYPAASEVMITADSGGSNSARSRLWKVELQELADRTGLSITVCHFPPGTSKWNKIEHRMFSFISKNWRGRPLADRATIVELIGSTTTTEGLKIRCELDLNEYPTGIKVPDARLNAVNLVRHRFHGDWNYTIRPRHKT